MPKNVVIDEFHLQIFVPTDLQPAKSRAIRRFLNSRRFHLKLTPRRASGWLLNLDPKPGRTKGSATASAVPM